MRSVITGFLQTLRLKRVMKIVSSFLFKLKEKNGREKQLAGIMMLLICCLVRRESAGNDFPAELCNTRSV